MAMTGREDLEDTISRLGLYIDIKQWEKLDEVLGEYFELDYRSLFGGSVETVAKAEIIGRWKPILTPSKQFST